MICQRVNISWHMIQVKSWKEPENSMIGYSSYVNDSSSCSFSPIWIFIWPTARVVHLHYSSVSFFLGPTVLHHTHDLACVKTREREREEVGEKAKKEREKERIIIVQSARQRIRTHIYIHICTRTYHFSKLLDPVHIRVYSFIFNNAYWSFCTLSITISS